MIFIIAHRGNVDGPNPERENMPAYIDEALKQGFDVEVDVWVVNEKIYLGHDRPTTPVSLQFLHDRSDKLWCHAKNLEALSLLLHNHLHVFFHNTDAYVLTSKGIIWAYPGQSVNGHTICVLPEKGTNKTEEIINALGICTDFASLYRKSLSQSH